MSRVGSTVAPVLPGRSGLARRVLAASVCTVLWVISCVDVAAGPLPHAAYIWQRAWHAGVTSSLAVAAAQLDGFIVLAAEIGPSRSHRVAYDSAALAASGSAIGLALRVNSGAALTEVPALAAQLVATARSNRLSVAELQLDYDCPEMPRSSFATPNWRAAPSRAPLSAASPSAWPCRPMDISWQRVATAGSSASPPKPQSHPGRPTPSRRRASCARPERGSRIAIRKPRIVSTRLWCAAADGRTSAGRPTNCAGSRRWRRFPRRPRLPARTADVGSGREGYSVSHRGALDAHEKWAERGLTHGLARDGAEAPERLPPEGGTPASRSWARASPSEYRL